MEGVDLYRAFAPLKASRLSRIWTSAPENFLGLERTGIFINDLLQLPGLLTLFLSRALLEGGFSVTSASLKGGNSEEPALSIQAELENPFPAFLLHLPQAISPVRKRNSAF